LKIAPTVRPGRRIEKKVRTGQDRTGQDSLKKSHIGNMSPIWGEAPTAPIETKICMVGYIAYVFTCAKLQGDNFRGYNFTGGEFTIFLLIFALALLRCL